MTDLGYWRGNFNNMLRFPHNLLNSLNIGTLNLIHSAFEHFDANGKKPGFRHNKNNINPSKNSVNIFNVVYLKVDFGLYANIFSKTFMALYLNVIELVRFLLFIFV